MSTLSDLLDSEIDDLADLPEFKVFPPGVHKVKIKWEEKEVNDNETVELQMSAIETIELANPEDTPLAPGDEASVLFMLTNEFAQGAFKKILKVLAPMCGTKGIKETMEASSGMEIDVVTKVRTAKSDKTKQYTDIVKIVS